MAVSATTLIVTILVLRSVRRTEWAGERRLNILREEQERMELLHRELHMLEEELKWRRGAVNGGESVERKRDARESPESPTPADETTPEGPGGT